METKKKEVARNSMQGTLKMYWNSCKGGVPNGHYKFLCDCASLVWWPKEAFSLVDHNMLHAVDGQLITIVCQDCRWA